MRVGSQKSLGMGISNSLTRLTSTPCSGDIYTCHQPQLQLSTYQSLIGLVGKYQSSQIKRLAALTHTCTCILTRTENYKLFLSRQIVVHVIMCSLTLVWLGVEAVTI